MPKKYDGSKKFNWQGGDVQFTFPQCYYCSYNSGKECEIYGPKPKMFTSNAEECPYKLVNPKK